MNVLDLMFLAPYKKRVDEALKKAINQMGPKNSLRDAVEYSLMGKAKRFRPLIVLFIAEDLGNNDVMEAALSVEYFHTASLIVDDLPCMDDDDIRRGKPSLHKVYNEDVALLASYTLIARGYESISLASQKLGDLGPLICQEAISFLSKRAGILGATGGQYYDLYPPNNNLETLESITYQKTVTLFEISFALGFLFGGGEFEKLPKVTQAANHLGYAFQLADDLQDLEQDEVSLATLLGKEKAIKTYQDHRDSFDEACKEIGLNHKGLNKLVKLLDDLANKVLLLQ